MVRKRVKKVGIKKSVYKGPDLIDINARIIIAFTLTMILAILMYVVFLK